MNTCRNIRHDGSSSMLASMRDLLTMDVSVLGEQKMLCRMRRLGGEVHQVA